jgi:hypothetical protein
MEIWQHNTERSGGMHGAFKSKHSVICFIGYRKITAQGSRKTLSKNYGARLAQGPLMSLNALDPDLRNPDFEAPDPRNLRNHAKTSMYRVRPKKMVREACQRSLHNAGKLPSPPGGPQIARAASRARLVQDRRGINLSENTL